jgi:hypothetical protein
MGAGGAAAAAVARRRMLTEEEGMTTYSADDLDGDWEFKIVRGNMNAFRKSSTLNRLLQEEAQAGWTMVEKFDDQRIRFKRPRQARLNDATLPPGVDPYRVNYGMSPLAFTFLIVAVVLGLIWGIEALFNLFAFFARGL